MIHDQASGLDIEVTFAYPENGGASFAGVRDGRERGLIAGRAYRLRAFEAHDYHTLFWLEGHVEPFNSCQFSAPLSSDLPGLGNAPLPWEEAAR